MLLFVLLTALLLHLQIAGEADHTSDGSDCTFSLQLYNAIPSIRVKYSRYSMWELKNYN
jgi:hypothetical protein